MRLIIVGPPGAGKGTQAEKVAEKRGIPHISTGDIFRANIKNATPLGKKVSAILAAGKYVSDDLTNEIVADRLSADDASNGFLLDGYPRTLAQVEALDTLLASKGQTLDGVIELTVDTDEVIQRLLLRAQTSGRSDDTEEVIRGRQVVYTQETAPLLEVYSARGLVLPVDGMGTMEEVFDRIDASLDEI